jgi:hypothetical protein
MTEQCSNTVLCDVDVQVLPPPAVVEMATRWLQGKLGTYPCLDCGPNLFLIRNANGEWVAQVQHDDTCPINNGVL